MKAVGDEAVFHFSIAAVNCQAAVVNRVIHNWSWSLSLPLASIVNACMLASSCLGAPANPESHRGLLTLPSSDCLFSEQDDAHHIAGQLTDLGLSWLLVT